MATYKTPGVYVEEISTLPPSIAEVETAIPAFMGFTEKGARYVPERIASLVDYQLAFGSAEPERNITVTVQDSTVVGVNIDPATKSKNIMFYALQLYFANGGGPCYIVSTGNFADSANNPKDAYNTALDAVAKEDEPTLLVFPDASLILSPEDYYSLMNAALVQCEKLGDRFAIIDVINRGGSTTASVDQFRNLITGNLGQGKYGAAYFPDLKTSLSYRYDEDSISIVSAGNTDRGQDLENARSSANQLRTQANNARAEADRLRNTEGSEPRAVTAADRRANDLDRQAREAETRVATAETATVSTQRFPDLTNRNNALQNQIKQKILAQNVQLPAAAAVVGVYASVDSVRGVWKAPANVSLNNVIAPTIKVTDDEQRDLNIDVVAGKSVNAIRSFVGQGTKIWGARTLAGNDNEWRYINVRRFFNMVEESIRKSTNWAVFEANNVGTWTRVRTMVENYLLIKWRDGALAGVKAEDAFFVRVGLGQTMTPQDVLEGRMNVEIGMAVVRPAEFIILKFSHKLQNS